jgi:hypothetical protein
MTHSLSSGVSQHLSPTLWPIRPHDITLTEFVLEASEEENRVLRKMVVGLSEIILESIVSRKVAPAFSS